ncbi:MAG: EamA family transporter, partial [Chloroflexi bacterium]|nr:EamA family transporter [Chloroflexota bacterium]
MLASQRNKAILQALFVTLLWSSSWVLIKRSIEEIPPLTFAGLRYSIAFLILLPGMLTKRDSIRQISKNEWGKLLLLGLVYYAFTQGGQFFSLKYLDAITLSLMLNFSAPLVAIIGLVVLHESVSKLQWGGLALFLVGVLVYFSPQTSLPKSSLGLALGVFTILSNAIASVLGRGINRQKSLDPILVTGISMGFGAVLMLVSGIVFQGLPPLSSNSWLILILLAVVNTALAFWLWNKSLQVLTAMESSIINNTMLIQISLLAWLFLGEKITWIGAIGLA